jgi:hypothetical protein
MSESIANENQALRARVDQLEAKLAELSAALLATSKPTNREKADNPARTRRDMLKLTGAAVVGAAGISMLQGSPANAADGGNIVIGAENLEEAETILGYDGTGSSGSVLTVGDSPGSLVGVSAGFRAAVLGLALGGSAGVPNAVFGYSEVPNGFAIIGLGDTFNTTHGVRAISTHGYGLSAGSSGTAQIHIEPSSSAGTPTTGTHARGELYVDSTRHLFSCLAPGTPGTWVKLSPLVPVSPPARAFDSRTSGGALGAGQSRDVSLTAGKVPAGASAALVNLTIVNTVGSGFLTMYAQGTSAPSTSNINWYANNQIVANNATPAVSASAQVTVQAGGSSLAKTNFIIDVFGYYP